MSSKLRAALLTALAFGGPLAAQEPAPIVRPLGGANPTAAALLARGGGGGALRLQAAALPVALPESAIPVLVVVELDGATLVAQHPGGRLGIELTLYAVDGGGRVAASRVEGIAVDLDVLGEQIAAGGLRWTGSLALDPGEWSLRVLARVRKTGAFGLRETRLTLPGKGGHFLAPVAPAAPGFLDAPSPALDPAAAAAIAALGGPPAALPLLAADAPARLWALASGGDPGPMKAALADGLGRPAGAPAVASRGAVSLGAGLTAVDLELAPPGGAAGLRDLALTAGGQSAAPRRLVVRPGAEPGAWIDLLRATATAEESSAAAPAPIAPLADREDLARYRAAYRDAFARWAAGDQEGGVSALATFEAGALASDKKRAMGWLEQADRPLTAALAAARPAAALPLALFYGELFRAHLGGGHVGLARRAEMRAADLLGRYATAAADEGQRALAAAAFEGMAADLLAAEAPQRAADLLERATSLAPGRVEDWVALGTLYEQARRLDTAAIALDRALDLDPKQREARLRRARIEILRQNPRRAAEMLDTLAAEPVADWIGVVAVQERARLLLAAGELPRAVALLEGAARRFPTEPSLALALSYAYERSGRRADARVAAERAIAGGAGFGAAPRKRYALPPTETLSAGRGEVESAGLLAASALAEAIAATAQEDAS